MRTEQEVNDASVTKGIQPHRISLAIQDERMRAWAEEVQRLELETIQAFKRICHTHDVAGWSCEVQVHRATL